MPLFPAPAQAKTVVVGVDLVNQSGRLTPEEQDTILDNRKEVLPSSQAALRPPGPLRVPLSPEEFENGCRLRFQDGLHH